MTMVLYVIDSMWASKPVEIYMKSLGEVGGEGQNIFETRVGQVTGFNILHYWPLGRQDCKEQADYPKALEIARVAAVIFYFERIFKQIQIDIDNH